MHKILRNNSKLPTWYIRSQIDFVCTCQKIIAADIPFPEINFYFESTHKHFWKGLASVGSGHSVQVWFDPHRLYFPKYDPRFKKNAVKHDVKNRTESFLFLLAHEMRHTTAYNKYLLYNGKVQNKKIWRMETDCNDFAQSCVLLYRAIKPSIHYTRFRTFQRIEPIAEKNIFAATKRGK